MQSLQEQISHATWKYHRQKSINLLRDAYVYFDKRICSSTLDPLENEFRWHLASFHGEVLYLSGRNEIMNAIEDLIDVMQGRSKQDELRPTQGEIALLEMVLQMEGKFDEKN